MSEKLHSVWPILALDGVGDAIGDPRPAFVVSHDARLLRFANAAGARFLALPAARALDCRVALEPRLAERLLRFAATARPGDETRELMRYFDGLRSTLLSVALARPLAAEDAILVVVDNARADPADADPAASLAAIAAEGGLVALFDGDGEVVVALGDHSALDGVQDDIEAALDADDGAVVLEHRVSTGQLAHDVTLVRLGSASHSRRLLRVGPGMPDDTAVAAVPPMEAPAPTWAATDAAPVSAPEGLPIAEPDELPLETPSTPTTEATRQTPSEEAPSPAAPPPEAVAPDEPPLSAAAPDAAPLIAALPIATGSAAIEVPPETLTETPDETPLEAIAPAVAVTPPEIPEPAIPPSARRPIDAGEDPAHAIAVVTETVGEATEASAETAVVAPEPDAPATDVASVVAASDAAPSEAASLAEAAETTDGFRWRSPGRAVKFVWQMDAERRFTLVSEELAGIVGPHAAALIGRAWRDVAADLGLDPEGRVAAALDRRDTWSGRTVLWPVEGEALRLPVDLAALPAFDRGRVFTGFRGFGTIRGDAAIPDPTAAGLRLAATHAAASDTPAATAVAVPSPFAILDGSTPPAIPGDTEVALVEAAHPRPVEPTLDGGEAAFVGETTETAETADRCAEFSAGMAPATGADEDWPDDELALAMATLPPCRDDEDGFAETPDDVAPSAEGSDEATLEPTPTPIDATIGGRDVSDRPDETAAVAIEAIDDDSVPAAQPIPPVSPLALLATEFETATETPGPVDVSTVIATSADASSATVEPPNPEIETEAATDPVEIASHGDATVGAPEEILEAAADAIASPDEAPAPLEPREAAPVADAPATEIAALAATTRPPVEAVRLSPPERVAFRQIAEVLGAHVEGEAKPAAVLAPRSATADPSVAPAAMAAAAGAPVVPAPTTRVTPETMARIAAFIHVDEPGPASVETPENSADSPANLAPAVDTAETSGAVADIAPNAPVSPNQAPPTAATLVTPTATPPGPATAGGRGIETRLLDRLPSPVAVIRDDSVAYANAAFLDLLGYPDTATLGAEGGLDALFAGEHVARRWEPAADGSRPVPMLARDGRVIPVDANVATVPWAGGSALMLNLTEVTASPVSDATASDGPVPGPLQQALAVVPGNPAPSGASLTTDFADTTTRERVTELEAIIDTATDGVLMLDAEGTILSANHAAEALFGVDRHDMVGRPLTDRLAPESRRSAMDYLDGLARNGVASVLNDGREVIGAVDRGGLIPLFMTIGRISAAPSRKYCAVLRDITHWKKSEEDLTAARRRAEEASVHKSDFLAKISHEIRTPLNAIIGFSEVMMDERFGPIGNERYKDYLRDIHTSGSHIMSLINDLLDLSKVEAGKMDLRFEAVGLGDIMSECVAMMQPQANRERIIIRSSLPAGVPPVVADPRSVRQVMLNLLSNAIKFTPSGGQVIVSTTLEDSGEVVMRVRDTGYGMTDKELQTAMEPFRQLHTTRSRGGGTGLGLPLTKALVEANRAVFRIDSTVGQGTLVTVTFPVTRVLAS